MARFAKIGNTACPLSFFHSELMIRTRNDVTAKLANPLAALINPIVREIRKSQKCFFAYFVDQEHIDLLFKFVHAAVSFARAKQTRIKLLQAINGINLAASRNEYDLSYHGLDCHQIIFSLIIEVWANCVKRLYHKMCDTVTLEDSLMLFL